MRLEAGTREVKTGAVLQAGETAGVKTWRDEGKYGRLWVILMVWWLGCRGDGRGVGARSQPWKDLGWPAKEPLSDAHLKSYKI